MLTDVGVGISYLIIIGDLMPQVIEGFNPDASKIPFLVDRHFWITAFMLFIIPLSFLRRLDSLKYTSFIALTSIGYLVILVLYHFLARDTLEDRGPVRVITWAGAVPALSAFPVVVFAYTCHQNVSSVTCTRPLPPSHRLAHMLTGAVLDVFHSQRD